jgi:YD repeat-containing protein
VDARTGGVALVLERRKAKRSSKHWQSILVPGPITYDPAGDRTRDAVGSISSAEGSLPLRRITQVDGNAVRQVWCSCGRLDPLVDANGDRTGWERDLQGRVTREVRADGVTDTT